MRRSGGRSCRAGAAPAGQAPPVTLPALVEAQAARTPDAVALACQGTRLSYAELNARANRLARVLAAQGAGPESVVAVVMERSAELIVALLAVLKSGGAYLPVDPGCPADQVAFMLGRRAPGRRSSPRGGAVPGTCRRPCRCSPLMSGPASSGLKAWRAPT